MPALRPACDHFCSGRLGSGGGGFGWELEHLGAHLLAGLELDHGAGGNRHVRARRVRVAPDAGLAHLHLEYAEVAKLHLLTIGQGAGDAVQRLLDYIKDLPLLQRLTLLLLPARLGLRRCGLFGLILFLLRQFLVEFFGDLNHQVALC